MSDPIRVARTHNERTPIYRISNENMCEIFLVLALVDIPSPERPLGWFSVGSVCHLWRELAMNYPELWARSAGSFLTDDMTDLALERAQSMALSFDGYREEHGSPDRVLTEYQLSLIEEYVPRLRSLGHDDFVQWSDLFYRLGSFPVLESARIWDDSGVNMWDECIGMPRLQSLYLKHTLIPINASGLRYLRVDMDNPGWRLSRDLSGTYEPITEGCQASPGVFPIQEFTAFLQRSPQLERLVVTDIPELDDWESFPTSYARLPRLRVLHLGGRSLALSSLWGQLSVPPDTLIFIDTDTTYLWSPRDRVLRRAFGDLINSPRYDSLKLGMTSTHHFLLQLWDSVDDHTLGVLDLSTSLSMTDPILPGPALTIRLMIDVPPVQDFLDFEPHEHSEVANFQFDFESETFGVSTLR